MSTRIAGTLAEALKEVRTRPLFIMRLAVRPYLVVGATPGLYRRVGLVPGGSFAGERLSGEVTEGGSDWQSLRGDGATTLDVRLILKTDDGVFIGMAYQGLRHGPADIMHRLDNGEDVDPANYYFRMHARFEAAGERYEWLNRIIAIGIGQRARDGVTYSLFEVL